MEDWKQFFMLTQIHTVAFAEYDSRHDEELKKALEEGGNDNVARVGI